MLTHPQKQSPGIAHCLSVLLTSMSPWLRAPGRPQRLSEPLSGQRGCGSRQRLTHPTPWASTVTCFCEESSHGTGQAMCLRTVCGCFCSNIGGGELTMTPWPMKPKIVTIWPFTGEPSRNHLGLFPPGYLHTSWLLLCPTAHATWGHPVVTC